MWKAEVYDRGPTGVGTAVKVCPSLTSAMRFVVATLANPWAGPWSITAPDGTCITEPLAGERLGSEPDHDEEHHASTSPIALHPATD